MKKQTKWKPSGDLDTMRAEYDFSKGVRGKHAAKYAEGTNVVVLEPDVALQSNDRANERDLAYCFETASAKPKTRRPPHGITKHCSRQAAREVNPNS